MKLSIQMIADWLEPFNPQKFIKFNRFEVETVRFYSKELEASSNTIYIGSQSEMRGHGERRICCMHNHDYILLDSYDIGYIANQILNAFEYYSTWDSTMISLLTSGGMLQDLMDASQNIINRPLVLIDSSQRLLAVSSNYKIGDIDDAWDSFLSGGGYDIDYLIQLNERNPQRFDYRGVYTYDEPLLPHKTWHYNFFTKGIWTGHAIVVVLEEPMSEGEVDRFSLFCGYLERWFLRHIQEQDSVMLESLLLDAIKDERSDCVELHRKLQLAGWKSNDRLIFLKLDAAYQPYSINTHLCRTLNEYFDSIYAIRYDLSICVLCNLSLCSFEELKKKIRPLLLRSKYYGVTGLIFKMEGSLFGNYKYIDQISDYCDKTPGELYDGRQHTMLYAISELQKTIIPEIIHPLLFELQDYDRSHRTDLYKTLYVYLKNERSPIATAKELNLHRNSLTYRLKQLEELMRYNLDDFNTRLHILISYKIESASSRTSAGNSVM